MLNQVNRRALRILLTVSVAVRVFGQSPKLQITAPLDGTTFSPGSTVTISIAAEGQLDSVGVIAEGMGFSQVVNRPPYSFSFDVPNEHTGLRQITAVGFTGAGDAIFSSPILIDIETEAALAALTANLRMIRFRYVGQQIPLSIAGKFKDRTVASLTNSSRLSYSSSSSGVVLINSVGLLTSVGAGQANIVARYGSVSLTIPVSVPKSARGDLNGDGTVDQDDLNIILSALNMEATKPFDARDLNGDGLINALDARILVTLCTRAGCATH